MAQNHIGKTCPYCQFPIKHESETVQCPACKSPHHQECWEENEGCTTFGCQETSFIVPTSGSQEISIGEPVNQRPSHADNRRNNLVLTTTLIILILLSVLSIYILVSEEVSDPSENDVSVKENEINQEHQPNAQTAIADTRNSVVKIEDSVLIYLGKSAAEIMELFGAPDHTGTYQGSLYWLYQDRTFFFNVGYMDESKTYNLDKQAQVRGISARKAGDCILGAKLGMTIQEIESILGHHGDSYYCPVEKCLFIRLPRLTEEITNVELFFDTLEDNITTNMVEIIWKD